MRIKKEAAIGQALLLLAVIMLIIGGAFLSKQEAPTGMAAGGAPGPPDGSTSSSTGSSTSSSTSSTSSAGGSTTSSTSSTGSTSTGGGSTTSSTSSTGSTSTGGGTTTTATESGESGPLPIKVVAKNPKDGDTIKRGTLSILVNGYEGTRLNSGLRISAESELFGTLRLADNFEQRGMGTYGANVTIGRNITKAQYAIVVKGEKGTYDEERILITVDPTIHINASLDKKEYFKGERITLTGNMAYFDQKPVKNNTAEISISAKDFLLNTTVTSGKEGTFRESYLISFAEPDGEWTIKIKAADKSGNEGSEGLSTKVSTPEGLAFYTVTFLSPFKNAEFKRGSIVPITVEIEKEGEPVEEASVDFRSPKAEITSLTEIAPGTYSAEYKLKPDDPPGEWYVAVQAVKTMNNITRAGGMRIPVTIKPATLNLVLIKPVQKDFFAGLQAEIRAELSYADRAMTEKADVFAAIGDKKIRLEESDVGTYSAFYLFTERDINATSLQLSAFDIYGNSVTLAPQAIEVRQIGRYELKLRLFYYTILAPYWYMFMFASVFIILITKPLWHKRYLQGRLKKTVEEEKRVIEMEKDTQLKYFKDHSISREDYDKLMLRYQERASDLKENGLRLKKRLGGKEKEG